MNYWLAALIFAFGFCLGGGLALYWVGRVDPNIDGERVLIGYTGGGNGQPHDLQVWAERHGRRWWMWMENPKTNLRTRLRDHRYIGEPDTWGSLDAARACAGAAGVVEKRPS
jgi:dienelactone hydrolase